MKNFLILIFSILSVTYCYADLNYKKFIEKHNIDEETMKLETSDPNEWWNSLISNNLGFQEFLSDIEKGKGAEKEALKITSMVPRFIPRLQQDVLDDCEELCRNLQSQIANDNNIEICIVDNPNFGAFSTYGEPGMTVVLHSSLFEAKGMTDEILIGILAHEYAHCYLLHILQHEYAFAKKKRKNKALEEVIQTLNAVSAGVDAYTSALLGTEVDTDFYAQNSQKIKHDFKLDLFTYYYNYSREQEYEADLIAYRFMEWAGYGGDKYLEALKIVEANEVYPRIIASIDDTHPTTRDRINFLEYVREHPEITNTNNVKIAKKKAEREYFKKNRMEDSIYW